jgi:CHAT domain-containing protein
VALPDIAGRLAPEETLVNYFLTGDSLYALVMNGTAVTGMKLPAVGLVDQIRAFRKAIESNDAAAGAKGRVLYDRLIRPLAGQIKGPRLTLCPHGALHYVPFAALLDGDQYLIDRYSVRVMPSASALAYLKTDKPEKVGKVLALGDPDLGDARYDLPNALAEAVQVAQMFPDSRALLRKEASKTAVKELGGSFSILHFASHAVFDPDTPLASGLFLAKGNEPDGRLTVRELYAMRLDAQLVTLSACQTGLGKVLSGDEVIGLTRGFFYAGARTIVASLWSVQDQATAELMVSFYRNLAHADQREALRLAQIQTRKTHPAPVYWAAFEITGSAN